MIEAVLAVTEGPNQKEPKPTRLGACKAAVGEAAGKAPTVKLEAADLDEASINLCSQGTTS